MINNLLSKLRLFNGNSIYELLAYQPHLRLCVDVGAAAGLMTQKIWQQANSSTRIIALEPFEHNHGCFSRNTRAFNHQVQLVKKAASNRTGITTLSVPSLVQDTEKNWQTDLGVSFTGHVEGNDYSTLGSDTSKILTIETIALDDLIQDHIDFMRIDAQGREYQVLQGASHLLHQDKIDAMCIAFSGTETILNLLQDCNYTVFDTLYSVTLRPEVDFSVLERYGFHSFALPGNGLTGARAVIAKRNLPLNEDYCQFFQQFHQEHGYVRTDLVAISSRFIERFTLNLGTWLARIKPQTCTPEVSRQRYPACWDSRQ